MVSLEDGKSKQRERKEGKEVNDSLRKEGMERGGE